jgi:hypothetical protein
MVVIFFPSPLRHVGSKYHGQANWFRLWHKDNTNNVHVSALIAERLHARPQNGVFLADFGT